jgi:trimethylamine:corrinoid methyltransferase-like protein
MRWNHTSYLAGTMVTTNAEILGGIVLAQLINKAIQSYMDLQQP